MATIWQPEEVLALGALAIASLSGGGLTYLAYGGEEQPTESVTEHTLAPSGAFLVSCCSAIDTTSWIRPMQFNHCLNPLDRQSLCRLVVPLLPDPKPQVPQRPRCLDARLPCPQDTELSSG